MGASLEITGTTAPLEVTASLSIATRLVDIFRPTAEIKIEIKGLDYLSTEVPVLWFYKREAGSSFAVTIRGKPGFCLSMVEYLSVISDPSQLAPPARGARLPAPASAPLPAPIPGAQRVALPMFTRIVDFFRFQNTLEVEVTFPETLTKRVWFLWKRTEGPRISITVKGKPGFAQAVAGHLQLHGWRLKEILLPEEAD